MTDYHYIMENIKTHQDNHFYSKVFNIMTQNDKIKNYVSNNNGIFFDFNNVDGQIIRDVVKFIHDYNRKNEEKINYEKERIAMISKNDKKYTDTMQKLSKEIEKSILYTNLEDDFSEPENNTMEVDEPPNESYDQIDYKELFGDSDDD